MSSGMNLEEAKEYAETMSYRKAVNNIRYAKGIAILRFVVFRRHLVCRNQDKGPNPLSRNNVATCTLRK